MLACSLHKMTEGWLSYECSSESGIVLFFTASIPPSQKVQKLYHYTSYTAMLYSIHCRLLELSEAIEALDAAIEYKSDIIAGKEAEIRRSQVLSQVRRIMELSC